MGNKFQSILPGIELTNSQKLWLEAVHTKSQNNEKVSIRSLKVELIEKIPPDFNPTEIPHILLQGGKRITIFGILSVNPETDLFEKCDQVIIAIKNVLLEEPKTIQILAEDISEKTGFHENEVKQIFVYLWDLGKFIDSAGSRSGIGFDEITVGNVEVFNEYFTYQGIEQQLRKKFLKTEKNERQEKPEAISKEGKSSSDLVKEETEFKGLIPNAKWKDISIHIYMSKGEKPDFWIRIEAPNFSKNFKLDELTPKITTKVRNTLQVFAVSDYPEGKKIIDFGHIEKWYPKFGMNYQKMDITRLRNWLKEVFGIQSDPISDYNTRTQAFDVYVSLSMSQRLRDLLKCRESKYPDNDIKDLMNKTDVDIDYGKEKNW